MTLRLLELFLPSNRPRASVHVGTSRSCQRILAATHLECHSTDKSHSNMLSTWSVQRPAWPPASRGTSSPSTDPSTSASSGSVQILNHVYHPSSSALADGGRRHRVESGAGSGLRIGSTAIRHSHVRIRPRAPSLTASMLHWRSRHTSSALSLKLIASLQSGLFLNPKPKLGRVFCTVALEASGVTETGKFTLNDTTLTGRGLEFSTDAKDVDLEQLNSLFAKVGFPKRDIAKLRIALEHTVSLLVVTESEGGQLVAFARATGDAVFNAIIWDVVVDPRYQGSGLGKALMERLLARLVGLGICNIALYAEPNVVGFYRPLGFAPDPAGIRGMAYSKKRR